MKRTRKRLPERVSHDQISIEIEGKIHTGTRTITGTRRLHQTIEYGGFSKFDSHPYAPSEMSYMRGIAKIILGELVREHGNS